MSCVPNRRASHLVRVLLSGLLVPALGTGAVWGAGARQVHAVTPFEAAGTSFDDARAASAQRNSHKCKLQRDSQSQFLQRGNAQYYRNIALFRPETASSPADL